MANKPEGDSSTNGYTFTITRSGDLNAPMASIGWAIFGNGPTPADGADFEFGGVLPGGAFSFAPGQASTNLTVIVRGDTVQEPDEGFVVALTNAAFGAIISIIAPDQPEGNHGTTDFTFRIVRTGNTNVSVAGTFSFRNGATNAVDIFDGIDSSLFQLAGFFNFAPGVNSTEITVGVRGDLTQEPDETFELYLTSPIMNAVVSNTVATAIIRNDDLVPPPASVFSVLAVDSIKPEGNGLINQYTFKIVRTGDTNSPMAAVTWTLTGHGPNPVTSDDFSEGQLPRSNRRQFGPGETEQLIVLPVNGDRQHEPDEGMLITLSNPEFGEIATGTAVGVIQNDDTAPNIQLRFLSFSNGDARVEITAPANLNVSLEFSTDLRNWQSTASGVIAPNGVLILTEPGAEGLPARLYRVREAPLP